MKNYSGAIHEYIQNNRQEIVAMLSELVKIPSVTSEAEEGAIFGKECQRAILHTEALYRENGLDTFTQKDCAYTLGRTKGDEKVIGIFSHADVVSAVEEDWTVTKPFEPVEKDGFLVGRGAEDNKSGIVSAIWAIKAMKQAGVMPKSTLLLYTGGNEECGMSDLELFVKEQKAPDAAIVPDNEYPVCRGEKGIIRFWAKFRKAFNNIISINGGQSLNIVLGSVRCEMKYSEKLLQELHAACDGKSEYTLTAGDTIVLVAKGKSTHAAYSGASVNAFWVMIQALKSCESLGSDLEILRNAEKLVADPYSKTVGLATTDSEFKETTCTNGITETNEGRLTMSFDTRYGTEVDAEGFVEGYRKLLEEMDADCDVTERDDGYVIPESAPMIKNMTDAWYSITGDKRKPILSYGGTYARHLKNAVSIGTYIKTTPDISLPDGHGGAHQPDEIIDIDGLLKSIEVITHMIIKVDETLHS